jgi:hypothetical protein
MKILSRLMLAACLVLPLAACNKDEGPTQAVQAPMAAPADENVDAWRAYVQDIVPRHMEGVTNSPYVYFLPGESAPDFADQALRMGDKIKADVSRGIVSGNMLAYASPASAKMADMIIAAFQPVPPASMKGVKVLFIGQAADNERVKAAVEPAGVNYVFVEAK